MPKKKPTIISVMFCDGGRYWPYADRKKTVRVVLDTGIVRYFTLGEDAQIGHSIRITIPLLLERVK